MSTDLETRYRYGAQYITSFSELKTQIINKTLIPHQVEVQPSSNKKICWLECPYCYGLSAENTPERLSKERAIQVMEEIADGGVKKIIFAGYATDPLNCTYIDDLVEVVIRREQTFGFNTKAINVSERLTELLATPTAAEKNYISVSVDAGSDEIYNLVHAVKKSNATLYTRVVGNVRRIAEARNRSGAWFDISATYLINTHNNDEQEIINFITQFRDIGCNIIRFTFPQVPRGIKTDPGVIPTIQEGEIYADKLRPILEKYNTDQCRVFLVDADTEHDIFQKPRTVPCFARFIYPTVGFDGWLYHCSQSSSPNFRGMALGNLADKGFWDLFYDYDASNLSQYFKTCSARMSSLGCRCDRKEHIANASVIDSGVFTEILKFEP
ncbi:MAG: MoaA/NifB/PqqE/SkfB family radical SAM enzyme [Motiliproteus sp.]|jgi:MoaA/NifB/PqqE/SkfB family radical SAM enzyme